MLDNMAVALQKNRINREIFGGVQMVFVGDLFQLPPIVSKQKGRTKEGKTSISEAQLLKEWGYETEFFFLRPYLQTNAVKYSRITKSLPAKRR